MRPCTPPLSLESLWASGDTGGPLPPRFGQLGPQPGTNTIPSSDPLCESSSVQLFVWTEIRVRTRSV